MADTINMPNWASTWPKVHWSLGEESWRDYQQGGCAGRDRNGQKPLVEVESSASGVVRRLLVDEGAVVPVNSPDRRLWGRRRKRFRNQFNKVSDTQEKTENTQMRQRTRDRGQRSAFSSQQSPISNLQCSEHPHWPRTLPEKAAWI